METQFEQIRDQQKASWNKFSPGWKKWDTLMMDFLKPMGNEIISMLRLQPSDHILDIASGTGEPALTIASMLRDGKVVMTDVSEEMLEIAAENAEHRGIKNVETKVCDVCELPFPDNTFDAISCRFGFMFFPDMQLAAKEMSRVLKPGGRIATTVWDGPEKNFWITATMGTINKNMELPPPLPGAPGMFRCTANGLMQDIFARAELKNLSEKPVEGKLNVRNADTYWALMTEVAAPVVAALSQADDAMREKIRSEVYDALAQKFPDGNVVIDAGAIAIYGEK